MSVKYIFIFVIALGIMSCKKDSTDTGASTGIENQTTQPENTPPPTPIPGQEPPQNADGVWHYTCPNGHEGGAGSAVACSECGTTLVHNISYHSNTANANNTITPPGEQTPPTAEPPQNADGVWHYTCPNGHEGGAGSAVPCPECNTLLTHNLAYHSGSNQQLNTQTPNQQPEINMNAQKPAEPAQNANGVWHYTCPNGHSGGAGSATACGECGTTLVHNQAYHQ